MKPDIKELLAIVDKKFGKGALIRYGDSPKEAIEVVSTSVLSLDKALGIGGLPKGRIVEIYGPEASGKTTLCLHILAECQKSGGTVAFVDVEHALDPNYAENLGVNMDDMLLSQPDSGEQALEIVDEIVRSGKVDVVILDSIAALVTRAELDGEMGSSAIGHQARLMSQAMRKLTRSVSQANCLLIFINQMREKIGVMFGSPETTPGGKAIKYYASVRIDIRRIGAIKVKESGEDKIVGNETKIKVVKNKLSAPFKETKVELFYGLGISKESDLIDIAVEKEIFTKSGAWFAYNGKNFAQGREKAREFLKDKDFYSEIKDLCQD